MKTKQDLLDILPIGFTLIDNDNDSTPEAKGYFCAINDGTVHYNEDYGAENKGKIYIYFNTNYNGKDIFAEIRQDADTRKVYHGIIPTKEFFTELITNIR